MHFGFCTSINTCYYFITTLCLSRDLKFGVYTAQGSRTCQNRPGAYGFEELDAATYCGWGVDYLKIDNCGGKEHLHANTSWIKFKKAFDECYKETGREIVESVESCGDPDGCGRWIAGVANLWRTSGDIQSRCSRCCKVVSMLATHTN